MKRVLTLSTSEHGMWNRRFHSQYVKVRVYSSRERGRGGERRERERGLEGEGVSFSILCSPENPIMKRQSTKSSEPSTETEGPFIQTWEHHWGNSATQHAIKGSTCLLPKFLTCLSQYKKKKSKTKGHFCYPKLFSDQTE